MRKNPLPLLPCLNEFFLLQNHREIKINFKKNFQELLEGREGRQDDRERAALPDKRCQGTRAEHCSICLQEIPLEERLTCARSFSVSEPAQESGNHSPFLC